MYGTMATAYTAFFISNIFCIMPTKCIYKFHIILIINNKLVFVIHMQHMFYESSSWMKSMLQSVKWSLLPSAGCHTSFIHVQLKIITDPFVETCIHTSVPLHPLPYLNLFLPALFSIYSLKLYGAFSARWVGFENIFFKSYPPW
jgi:hypothetical protein